MDTPPNIDNPTPPASGEHYNPTLADAMLADQDYEGLANEVGKPNRAKVAEGEWTVLENAVGTWDIYCGDHKIADDISLKDTAEWICAEHHCGVAAAVERERKWNNDMAQRV